MARIEYVLGGSVMGLVLAFGAAACGSDGVETSGGAPSAGSGSGSSSGSGGTGNAGSGGGDPDAGLPPEQEIESSYRAPVVTGNYVWSANPESGRIAVIDPETLVVRLADAGFRPTELAALPASEDEGADRAIVLNSGSLDATILRADADAVEATATIPVHPGANAWAISKSGRWAVAWTEALRVDDADPALGFQDLTVIDLSAGSEQGYELSVGYRPSSIVFDEDEERVFVVTEPGLSVIELDDSPRVASLIELTEDPVSDPASRDVNITPSGDFAFVRVEGSTELGVVDLASGELSSSDLGAPITDLDLSADGKNLFAVVGQALTVRPATVDGVMATAATFLKETLRSVSVSSDSSFAVLYTTAVENTHVGAVLGLEGDFADATTRVVDVKAPVISSLIAPDAAHAIVLGVTPTGSSKAGAFAIVPAQMDRAVKVIGTDAPPVSVTFTPDGSHALLSTRDDEAKRYGAYVVELAHLAETFVPLASPPASIGMIDKKKRAFVAQLHPEGRITFVDFDGGNAHTLTGFELSAKVNQ